MRARLLLSTAVLVATLPGSASAGVEPTVGFGDCLIEARNGSAECIVQLDPNPNGGFYTSTWSGWGIAELECYVSGRSFRMEGGYGSEWRTFPHGADVCRMRITAWDGRSEAYVD